jgi:hypothetical protein
LAAINFWRRLRWIQIGHRTDSESSINGHQESVTKLSRLSERRKLLQARLKDARQEAKEHLEPLKKTMAGILLTGEAQILILAPLLIGGLLLTVYSNTWGLEAFISLDEPKRLALAAGLALVPMVCGLIVGTALRMPKGDSMRKIWFAIGFTSLITVMVATIALNLGRGLDLTDLEGRRRATLSMTEDLDADFKENSLSSLSSSRKLLPGLRTLMIVAMGVAGELASAFAFDQFAMIFIPLFTVARGRRKIRRFEDELATVVAEEKETRSRLELNRAVIKAEAIEIMETQKSRENKEEQSPDDIYRKDDDSLIPLAWRIVGVVLVIATVVFFSVTFASGAGQSREMTAVLIDLTSSVAARDEFNRNRSAVPGILNRIEGTDHRVMVYGITASSFGEGPILSSTTPNETGRYGEYLEHWRRSVSAKWQQLSSGLSPSAKCSNVFGAIARAAIEFEDGRAAKKRLIILSDMRQTCRGYNFEKSFPDGRSLLARIEREGGIPKLNGVAIWVLGVHTIGVDEEHWRKIRAFWIEYFRRADAIMKSFSPSRLLVREQ